MIDRAGTATSPFGTVLIAESDEAICWLSLLQATDSAQTILKSEFPDREFSWLNTWSQGILNQWIENLSTPKLKPTGSLFQMSVWNDLLKIPIGTSLTYSQLAERIGKPKAVRAVATAVARNPIALFIPCHRVIPASGGTGKYRWGADKKRAILEWEQSQS